MTAGAGPEAAAATPAQAAAPRLADDPWAWATLASVALLLVRCAGAPMGEPVAEDFDMLRHAMFARGGWLDGGGTDAFWRPLSFQAYFATLGRLALSHPRLVAGVHALLLAIALLLVYRVLRRSWPGWQAATAASAIALAEGTRTLVTWPSHFGDLGAILFSAVALHERAYRRMPTALVALVAALLCKEVALVTALLLPFAPGVRGEGPRGRVRWLLACGLAAVAWAAAYQWVRVHAGLELPHGIEREAAVVRTPLLAKLAWAVWNSLRAAVSLPAKPGRMDVVAAAVVVVLAGTALAVFARSAAARARVWAMRGWVVWGAAWFVLGAATLAPIYPLWAPARAQFPGVGRGIAAAAVLGAASPALAGGYVAARVAMFCLAPGAPATITPEIADRGEFVDFARMSRLQRLMVETRTTLRLRFPALPHGATIVHRNLPLSAEYAFGGAHAVQVWYRDTTIRWVPFGEFTAHPEQPVDAIVDYQPDVAPQVVLIAPAAMRLQAEGVALLRQGRWQDAIAALERADAAQPDRRAAIFLGDSDGRRAYCYAQLGDMPHARAAAQRALRASRLDTGAWKVLAVTDAARGDRAAAIASLDSALALQPGDEEAIGLRRQLVGAAK